MMTQITVDAMVDVDDVVDSLDDSELEACGLFRIKKAPRRPNAFDTLRMHARRGDLNAFLDLVERMADEADVILDTSRLRPAARRIAA